MLSAMETAGSKEMDSCVERKGIGTPSTRAGVIEKLVTIGYVRRKGRKLIPAEQGRILASLLPDQLKSPLLTAEWENQLVEIEKGKTKAEDFITAIIDDVTGIISYLEKLTDEEATAGHFENMTNLGECTNCGKLVVSGRYGAYCKGKCGMSFKVFGQAIDDGDLKRILSGENIRVRRKRKVGKYYTVSLLKDAVEPYSLEKDGRKIQGYRFKAEIVKAKGKVQKKEE